MADDVKDIKKVVDDKEAKLKNLLDRMALVQRRHGLEMMTIKGQCRSFLFAKELIELGIKAEDLK